MQCWANLSSSILFIIFVYLLHLFPWEVWYCMCTIDFCDWWDHPGSENANSCFIIGCLVSGESSIFVLIYLLLQQFSCLCNKAMFSYPHLNAPHLLTLVPVIANKWCSALDTLLCLPFIIFNSGVHWKYQADKSAQIQVTSIFDDLGS